MVFILLPSNKIARESFYKRYKIKMHGLFADLKANNNKI